MPETRRKGRRAWASRLGVATTITLLAATALTQPSTAVGTAIPSVGGAPAPPSSGSVALTWAPLYMSDDHGYDEAAAVSLARRFDVVAAMPVALKDHVLRMKQVNPELTVIAYSAATLLGKDKTAGVPEAAFAHDSAGKRITYLAFDRWLMEGSNPTWVQMASDECDRRAAMAGYDGCLVDMLGEGVVYAKNTVSARPVNPATGAVYTDAEYRVNMAKLYAHHRRQSPSLVHVGNAVGNMYRYWKAPVRSSALTDTMSAAQMEDFLRGARDAVTGFPSAADWKLNVDVIRDFESKGKAGFFTTKLWAGATSEQVARWHKYAMASFLMGANGRSYFAFTKSRDRAGASQVNLPYEMPKDIGAPSSSMVQLDSGAWTRTFANGMSVVNPTAGTVTVTLPAMLKALDGTLMRQVVLGPSSGEVLIGSPVHPSGPSGAFTSVSAHSNGVHLLGTASASKLVSEVAVAVLDKRTGLWLQGGSSWGAYRQIPATMSATNATKTTWAVSLTLPAGTYGVSLSVKDATGALNAAPRPWTLVTVPGA